MKEKQYVRLCPPWAFRGWYGRPGAIMAESGPNKYRPPFFYDKETFEVLLKCDGEHIINTGELSEAVIKKLEGLFDLGILASSDDPQEPLETFQHYKSFESRFIEVVEWAITGKCNLKCRHCLVNAPDYHRKDLSPDQCIKIIDQLHDCGVRRIELTGGEPFMRRDWPEIVKGLSEKDVIITDIFTNGLLVNDKVLDIFTECGQRPRFQISYDGYGHHDWLRQVKGAQEGAEKAIKLLKARGFYVSASMCLNRRNKDSLRDTVRRLSSLGVQKFSVTLPLALGEWQNAGDEALTFEEEWEIYKKYIPEYFNDNMPIDLELGGYFTCPAGSKDYSIPFERKALSEPALEKCRYCVEGTTRIFISPEGIVYPCMGFSETVLKDKMPSLLKESLADITKDSSYRKMVNTTLKDLRDACKDCADCEHFPVCRGGCMLNGMTAEGNFLVPDPSACYFYKNVGVSRIREFLE